MAAYLIGQITVRDPAKWRTYVEGVRATLVPFRGEVLFRGKRATVLVGEQDHDLVVVLRFPDGESLQGWYRSPAYQSLVANRDEAAELVLVGYDEVT